MFFSDSIFAPQNIQTTRTWSLSVSKSKPYDFKTFLSPTHVSKRLQYPKMVLSRVCSISHTATPMSRVSNCKPHDFMFSVLPQIAENTEISHRRHHGVCQIFNKLFEILEYQNTGSTTTWSFEDSQIRLICPASMTYIKLSLHSSTLKITGYGFVTTI